MTWRLEINHVTCYRYDRPVVASYNEARTTPMTTSHQIVIDSRLTTKPVTTIFSYWDYWGTLVRSFDIHDPHQMLVVTSTAVVETGSEPGTVRAAVPAASERGTTTWDDLSSDETTDGFYEYLAPTALVPAGDLVPVADELRRACATPAEAVPAVMEWANAQLEYSAGATHVGTSAIEAWRAGRGVCQDYSHLSLAVLRAMGIPARYVSGYFYPNEQGIVGSKVVGESHAWVEAWTGDWEGWDPTNCIKAEHRHVVVARGRDYTDVAPMRGIYSGPPGSSTEVVVELTRRA